MGTLTGAIQCRSNFYGFSFLNSRFRPISYDQSFILEEIFFCNPWREFNQDELATEGSEEQKDFNVIMSWCLYLLNWFNVLSSLENFDTKMHR